jgi:hypothetical protein
MYDDEALYLGGRVEDPTPLQNLHDPEVEPERAWEGDACQFRMALDPDLGFPIPQDQWNSDRIVHALLWQYSEDEEPYLQLHYGFDYESPYGREDGLVDLDAFDAAYRTFDEDGTTGYTFEYRIPWETLHASEAGGPPGPGDLVAGTVQFNWDGGKGLKADRYKYGLLSDSGFPYQRPSPWGKIVMAERNDLPGSLVESSASIPKPLPMSVDYSLPTGGEVTLALYDDDDRFVKHIAVEAPREAGDRTAKFDGLDAFDRPLDPGDYTLKGLVHDPLELQFVTSVHNSGTPPHKTEDGTGGWGADHGVPTTAAAMGDDVLLAWSVSETGDGIIRVDSTGDKQWGADRTSEYLAQHPSDDRYFGAGGHGTYSWTGAAVFDGQNGRQLKFSESGRTAAIPEADDDVDNTVTGLATGGDRLYVAFGDRDLVAVNDVDTGELLETHAVPSPQRVAASDDRALVVSGAMGHVHDPTAEHEGGAPPAVVTTQIEDPRGIALDDRGRIYVANGGDRQNVTVHDADGSLVSEIGANGGRPLMGTFEPDGMLEPGGIAIGAEGRLWVAETLDAPKRHSVWDTRTGDLVDHYFGASAYSAGAHMEPSRPEEVFCHNCLWNVDLDTGEKEIVSTLFRREDPNAPTPRTGWRFPPETVIAENGHQYSWAGGQAQRQSLFLYKRERDTFHPLLGFFNLGDGDRPYPALSDTDQLPPGNYAWVDENGDDLIQADEVTRLDDPDTKNYNESIPWIHTVDEQLNLIDNEGIWRPESVDDDGVPTYDFESGPDTFPIDGVRGYFDNIHPTDDSFFTVSQADGSISEPDQTPGFSRWSRDGDLMWGFTNTARWANVLQTGGGDPGDMYGLTAHLGVAGGFTGAATYFGDSHITTTDGVYVASIFRKSGRVDYDTRKAETFTGQLVQPEGTDRYFHLGGDQDGRIVEVHGLNSVQRLDDRTYTVTEEMSERAQRAFE